MVIPILESAAMASYRLWYLEDVSPYLSRKEKESVLKRISDLSQKTPIYEANTEIPHSEVPELKKYSKTKSYTGLQLCAVMDEIYKEFSGK